MVKAIGFIDGFNVYHALVQENERRQRPYAKYRWIDYWRLTEQFLHDDDTLEAVYYFTAYIAWKSPSGKRKKARHRKFIAAQRNSGMDVILGRFRPVTRDCKAKCRETYKTYEEKRTDVNIAVKMMELAFKGEYEKAILISADSDLIPAIQAVRRIYPLVRFTVVVPLKRKGRALQNEADYFREMRVSHLKRSLLPETITLSSGKKLEAPPGWL